MSAVVSGVKAKLALRLPGQIGTNRQWSDTYIETLILAAAHAAAERIGYLWTSQVISLANDTHEYALNSTFVAVQTVKYSADGTNYYDHLSPSTFERFDRLAYKWRDDRGTQPRYYTLLSAPGLQEVSTSGMSAKISIYPALASASPAKIKVEGPGIGTASTNVPDDVQEIVHIPYVMSILRSVQNPEEAAVQYAKFLDGCDIVRGRFITPYPGGTSEFHGSEC